MANWQVVLTKRMTPFKDDFPQDYFPRPFHYKREAVKLVEEVQRKGGDAKVVRYAPTR